MRLLSLAITSSFLTIFFTINFGFKKCFLYICGMKDIVYHIEDFKKNKYHYFNAINDKGEIICKIGVDVSGDDYYRFAGICNGKKIGKIIYVISNLSICGNGVATTLLNKVIETLKDYNLYLNVIPMPREGEAINHRTVHGLREFYKKFGFETIVGTSIPTMFRKNKN